jgi:hypothetical protein
MFFVYKVNKSVKNVQAVIEHVLIKQISPFINKERIYRETRIDYYFRQKFDILDSERINRNFIINKLHDYWTYDERKSKNPLKSEKSVLE